jgi:hypothetical protein
MKFVYRKSWNYGYLALDLGRPDPKKCLNYGHPGRHDFSGASFQEHAQINILSLFSVYYRLYKYLYQVDL